MQSFAVKQKFDLATTTGVVEFTAFTIQYDLLFYYSLRHFSYFGLCYFSCFIFTDSAVFIFDNIYVT